MLIIYFLVGLIGKKNYKYYGERYSGKTHLIEIFLEKNKGLLIDLKKIEEL